MPPVQQPSPLSVGAFIGNVAAPVLSTLAAETAAGTSIESKVAAGVATASDVAAIASKVAGVSGALSLANLTHGVTVASAAAALPGLAVAVAPMFPAYAQDIVQGGGAIGVLLGIFGAFFTRKAAVANSATSAAVAPVAAGS